KESGFGWHFISRLANLDTVPKQHTWLGCADAFEAQAVSLCFCVPIHRRGADAEEFMLYFFSPAILIEHQFSMCFQRYNQLGQVANQILPTGIIHDAPQPEQLLPGCFTVFGWSIPSSVDTHYILASQRGRGHIPPGS